MRCFHHLLRRMPKPPPVPYKTTRRVFLATAAGLCVWPWVHATPVATVAAAASLKFALEELAQNFQRSTGQPVRLVFGASGNLYSQVLQGAPFHLFLSADEALVLQLASAGRTLNQSLGRKYAQGRLSLLVPNGSPLQPDPTLQDLRRALDDGRLRRFAIANPSHAPYGMRAREALQHAGLWAQIENRLVFGENVAQAAQFATSGSAQGGLVAHALALAPELADRARHALLPAEWHQPLTQRLVLLPGAPPAAVAFERYLATPEAVAILARHGYSPPPQ